MTVDGKEDWNIYIARMFCSIDDLQTLCKPCHHKKSKDENYERKVVKASKRKKRK